MGDMMMKVNFGDVFELCYGKSLVKHQRNVNGTYPVFGSGGYSDHHDEYLVDGPCVIIGRKGSIGSVYFSEGPAWVIDTAYYLKPKKEVNLRYAFHLLSTLRLTEMNKSAAIPGLNRDDVYRLKIPLPPLHIQQHMADTLDKADALRRKDQELLKKYDELAQSIFYDMFGDPVRNEKGWAMHKLQGVANKITDGEHLSPIFLDEGVPMVTAKNVQYDGIDFGNTQYISKADSEKFRKKCNPECNDLLIVSRGATIGRCCLVDTTKEFALMGSVILIKPGIKVSSLYLKMLFSLESYRKRLFTVSSASAQQAIYLSHLGNLTIPIPSIEVQNDFEKIIGNLMKPKTILRTSAHSSDNLFQALSHKFF